MKRVVLFVVVVVMSAVILRASESWNGLMSQGALSVPIEGIRFPKRMPRTDGKLGLMGPTWIVSKTQDSNDGVCDSDCSLREAIAEVNANTGGFTHRIEFSPLFNSPQTISVTSRILIDYNTRVVIIGPGPQFLTLTTAAGNTGGVLEVNSDDILISNIRFADAGNFDFQGGGAIVGNDGGRMSIENCIFENNQADEGGAVNVQAFSSITIKDSTFRNNTATTANTNRGGGAIFLENYVQEIGGCTFTGNQAINGGAVFASGYGVSRTTVFNSTFSGNTSPGGSILLHGFNAGSAKFTNITVANNTAAAGAVSNFVSASQTAITNSIVSQNSSGQLGGTVFQIGPNLIGGNPLLGPLANNGGPTETRALLPGSPAIDSGTATGAPATDQRGISRPQGAAFDLGAFESDLTRRAFTVTKTADTNDGVCDADCSLREAVAASIAAPETSVAIEFSPLFSSSQTILLDFQSPPGNFLPINLNNFIKSLEVRGPGADKLTVNSNGLSEAFGISGTAFVTFRGIRFTGGRGAIGNRFNANGFVLIENCIFENNQYQFDGTLEAAAGIVFHHEGSMTVRNSVFRNNQIFTDGAAVYIDSGNASHFIRIENSTFSGNDGAVASAIKKGDGTSTLEVINSTFSGNTTNPAFGSSNLRGATIFRGNGTVRLTNVTLTGNSNRGTGGAALVSNGLGLSDFRIRNTIVAGNTGNTTPPATSPNINTLVTPSANGVFSDGGNLIGFATGFTVGSPNAEGDLVGDAATPLDPLLGALANNGGPTETHALLSGSPAINSAISSGSPGTDQRGVSRPQGAGFDIGAFELDSIPPLQITTNPILPPGTVGQTYSQQIVAANGAPPYGFAVTGGSLPNGITLAADGSLGGVPTQYGNFSFTVTATDSGGATASKSFQLTIQPVPIQIVTSSNLPLGMVNQAYAQQIVAQDGAPPYGFAVTGGTLPNGITLAADGSLGGVPTQYGNFSFTVTATDSIGGSTSRTFQLTIQPVPLQIVTSVLPFGFTNRPYSAQIVAGDGAPPYVFSQTGGTLPNGVSLSSDGVLSGTPTALGSSTFEVTVTDSFGGSAQRTFFITVYPALEIWTGSVLPTGITNQSYSRQISAVGGFAPYSFSLQSGALPSGFSLSAIGEISGTAIQSSTSSFVIRVTDSVGNQVQRSFTLTISDLYVVTTNADTNDGVCDAHCSLREAVAVGDSVPGASNVIEFSPFFDAVTRIVLNSTIFISKTTEIRGKGRNKTLISSVSVNAGTKFVISAGDVTFRDLRMDEGGLSIGTRSIENRSLGRLTIENAILQGSYVTNSDGGAVFHAGRLLVVDNSTFRNNTIVSLNSSCTGRGAAIGGAGGLEITNSTFSSNTSPAGSVISGGGGGSYIENSTIAYNSPSTQICGLSDNSTVLSSGLTITNSTIVDNLNSGLSGSALRGTIIVENSVIARNPSNTTGATSPNFGPGVISGGHNLIGFAPSLTPGLPNANNDYVGSASFPLDPLLGPLALNGGETETSAPQTISLAINNGSPVGAPPTDQRGIARPQGAGVDIGAFETDVPVTSAATPAGSNVVAPLGTVSVTFSNVTDPGTTTQVPIDPRVSGTLPGGFSFGIGFPAFQITTTAQYTPPLTVCIQVPSVNDPARFNQLRLLHNENGALVDRTVSRDFATRTICAETSSLSPFAVAEVLAPTAASVSVSGRVLTPNGAGLGNAVVHLTDSQGEIRTARTGSFGYYRFDGIDVGQTVVVSVRSKSYVYAPRLVVIDEELTDLNFVPADE